MATASRVELSLDACGEFHVPGITKESAAKGSEILQENHDRHHIFWGADGFHSKSSKLATHLMSACLPSDISIKTLHGFTS